MKTLNNSMILYYLLEDGKMINNEFFLVYSFLINLYKMNIILSIMNKGDFI